MSSFLYRGVSVEMHKNNIALKPKGYSFSHFVRMGSSIAKHGNGIVHGKSSTNATIGHQENSSVYKTSGISTTPLIERAFYYATQKRQCNGFVYVLNRNLLKEYDIVEHIVADIVPFPKVPEDREIILESKSGNTISSEIVVEVIEINIKRHLLNFT